MTAEEKSRQESHKQKYNSEIGRTAQAMKTRQTARAAQREQRKVQNSVELGIAPFEDSISPEMISRRTLKQKGKFYELYCQKFVFGVVRTNNCIKEMILEV